MFLRSWKRWVTWMIFGTFITSLLFLNHQKSIRPLLVENESFYYDLNKEEPILKDQSCQLPRVHPFDSSILNYLSASKPIKCKERFITITFIDQNGILQFNSTALKLIGYKAENLNCDYNDIIRIDDFKVKFGQSIKLSVNGSKVRSEFISVSCYNFAGIPFYTNVHCHVIPKLFTSTLGDTRYNVLMFGIDSISRLSFIRFLPKTYKFLTQNLNAFIFRGMTKVGDNTFPNLGAILTGKPVFGKELPKIKHLNHTYDSWPFIWKNFSKAGYATLFAEDQPDIGLFTYLRNGLKYPPTDHYLRPFWIVVQSSLLHRFSSSLCFGDIPKHLLQIRYTEDFVTKYSNLQKAFFAFSFLVELSHDYQSQVNSADEDLVSWLSNLYHHGHLNRTFLFFMSDHGHRFDPMRVTLIGRIEERMPFFAAVIPPSILDSQVNVTRLKINQGRLTTPYDIYYTLLDILSFSENKSKLGSATSLRGTSLFGNIPSNRTCSEAGIPDHYCTCEKEVQIETSDSRSKKAADIVIMTINNMLHHHSNHCAHLYLAEIVRADLVIVSEEVVFNSRLYFGSVVKDAKAEGIIDKLRIIVKTNPGGALFESTLSLREDDEDISVVGDISRINRYGTQSTCINDATLRKYCYCVNLL